VIPTLVLGIGNADRGDDAVGLAVARRLRPMVPDWIAVQEHGGDGAALLDAWRGFGCVVLVDALRSGITAGDIVWLDARAAPLAARLGGNSTHLLGLAQAVELARALGQLPERIAVLGIECQDFAWHAPMSAAVAAAVDSAVALLLAELHIADYASESADAHGAA